MEPASFAASVLALTSLFNNAVNCFEYVQLGRNFGSDFQTNLLKLDDAGLRLSRWGQSVGLSGDLNDHEALHRSLVSAEAVTEATVRLNRIVKILDMAEDVSNKFKGRDKNDGTGASIHQVTELDPTAATLHHHMRDLAIKRQNRTIGTSLRQKARWALYEEKHIKQLIKDVTELVSGLTDLFPAAKMSQEALCEAEVRGFPTESLAVLKDAIAGQDSKLEAAITSAMNERHAHPSNISISGSNHSGLQLGENRGSMSGFNFHGGKDA